MNINYLENNNRKSKSGDLLNTYNLRSTVYFPTRTSNNSATLIDNIVPCSTEEGIPLNRVLMDCLIMMRSS
jgi:hypothetical protein